MMTTKDIKFIGFDPENDEISAKDGEIAINYGVSRSGSSLKTKTVIEVPEGYRVIAIHDLQPHPQVLMLASEGDNRQILCHSVYQDAIDIAQIREICPVGDIYDLKFIGDNVVIATDSGLMLMMWDDGYRTVKQEQSPVILQFGLNKVGDLISSDKIHTSDEVLATVSGGIDGSGAYRRHPSTDIVRAQTENLSKSIVEIYDAAVERSITSKGYLHQPFMLRYALRLSDGTHLMPSPPMLMLPTVTPPKICVSVQSNQTDGATIDVDLSANHYFELRYRLTQEPDQALRKLVTAVDVYATVPILTYDISHKGQGHITGYQDIISAVDSSTGHRGRTPASLSLNEVFDGHYSDSDDNYCDHTLADSLNGSRVWFVTPNSHLQDDIASAGDFHLIASIPFDSLSISSQFQPLPITSSHAESIASHPVLEDDITPHTPIVTAIHQYGGHIIAAADKIRLQKPWPIVAMSQFGGISTQPPSADVTVTVYIKSQGRVYSTSHSCYGHQLPLDQYIPRYLYYPHRGAFLMTLTQGDRTWRLPLSSHPKLDGAYWWGGIGDDYVPISQAVTAETLPSDIVPHDTHIYISASTDHLPLKDAAMAEAGETMGICHAYKAPQSGSFGDYPLYLLTSKGVWLMKYDDHNFTISALRKISHRGCINRQSITEADGAIIYTDGKQLIKIEGSSIKELSRSVDHMTFDINTLPHADKLLKAAKAEQVEVDTSTLWRDCMIIYHAKSNSLIICGDEVAAVYDLDADQWWWNDLSLTNRIYGREELAADMYNNVVEIERGFGSGLLISRTLKLGSPIEGRDITSVEVLGDFEPTHVDLAVYGANRLNRWRLIGSIKGEKLREFGSQHYRYYRVAVISRLTEGEYIHGLQIKGKG